MKLWVGAHDHSNACARESDKKVSVCQQGGEM